MKLRRGLPKFDPVLETAGEWCFKLAEGALSPEERKRFEVWMEVDPAHHRAFEDAVGIWRAVGETATTAELLPLRRDALTGFERAHRARWGRSSARMRWAVFGVAASVLMAFGGLWLRSQLASTTYSTEVAERRVIVLKDGSKLSMDAATTVSVRYSSNARTLQLLHGRAKFEVAHDPRRPFVVDAADKVVRALGTAFSVELLQGQVQVVLYEGRVEVLSERKDGAPAPVTFRQPRAPALENSEAGLLLPGQALLSPITLASAEVVPADQARSLAWEAGQLIFEHEPLATAVERVNRYADHAIRVGDEAAAAVRIDGVFAAGDTEAFVEGITGVFPLRAQNSADGTVLVHTSKAPR